MNMFVNYITDAPDFNMTMVFGVDDHQKWDSIVRRGIRGEHPFMGPFSVPLLTMDLSFHDKRMGKTVLFITYLKTIQA